MSLMDLCRLCLATDNLVWVFDERFEVTDSMKYVISKTTGVEICTTDEISQKICEKCCHIIVKMFEFRKTSLENDKQLRERLKTIKDNMEIKIKEEPPDDEQLSIMLHPTVRELYELHPHIKLPRVCLTSDLKPFVTMQMGEVERYFEKRKINFEVHCRLALRKRYTARKRTMPSPTGRSDLSESPCSINGQIIHQDFEDADRGVLRPIKIRILPKDLDEMGPGENQVIGSYAPEKNKARSNDMESDGTETEKTEPCHKKRKVDAENSPTKENENPGETGRINTSDSLRSLSIVANVSVPLHICNICDAVHDNSKELKRHRYTHLRCQFCKTTFRTMENKAEHVKSQCLVKNTMNNFPCIEVPKLDDNIKLLKTYKDAFTNFPSISKQITECCETVILSSSDGEEEPSKPVTTVPEVTKLEVIEIPSEDSDDGGAAIKKNDRNEPNKDPALKPEVKIIGNNLMDIIGVSADEINLLKKVLLLQKPVIMEKGTQTKSVDEHDIEINEYKQCAALHGMKEYLHVFRVPIKIKKGRFGVTYQPSVVSKRKKLQLWNDLTPTDIKKNNTRVRAASAGDSAKVIATNTTELSKGTNKNNSLQSVCPTTASFVSPLGVDGNDVPSTNVGISNSTKSTSSSHSHVSVVGAAALSTLPTSAVKSCQTTNNTTNRQSPNGFQSQFVTAIQNSISVIPSAIPSTTFALSQIAPQSTIPTSQNNLSGIQLVMSSISEMTSRYTITTSANMYSNSSCLGTFPSSQNNTGSIYSSVISDSVSSAPPRPVTQNSTTSHNKQPKNIPPPQNFSLLNGSVLPSPPTNPQVVPTPAISTSTTTAGPRAPVSFKIPYAQKSLSKPGSVFNNKNLQRPATPFLNSANRNQKVFTSPHPVVPTSTSGGSYNYCYNNSTMAQKTITTQSTFWPSNSSTKPTYHSVGYSNVPVKIINNRSAFGAVPPRNIQSAPSPAYSTAPIGPRRYSLPEQNYQTRAQQLHVQSQPLHAGAVVHVDTNDGSNQTDTAQGQSSTINPADTSNSQFAGNNGNYSFANQSNNVQLPVTKTPDIGYPLSVLINNNYKYITSNSTATGLLGTSSNIPTSIPQDSSASGIATSCFTDSTITAPLGQIRVKNMRELI